MTYIVKDSNKNEVKRFDSNMQLYTSDILRNYPLGFTVEVLKWKILFKGLKIYFSILTWFGKIDGMIVHLSWFY